MLWLYSKRHIHFYRIGLCKLNRIKVMSGSQSGAGFRI